MGGVKQLLKVHIMGFKKMNYSQGFPLLCNIQTKQAGGGGGGVAGVGGGGHN